MAGERQSIWGAFLNWIDRFVNWWSVAAGAGVITVGGVTAWAAWAADLLAAYQPFSWVAAGVIGAGASSLIFLTVQTAVRLRVRSRYDWRMLSSPSPVNPLDRTFQNRRIYVNEFVLPSHTVIENKTFIDCEIVGPANLYWFRENNALGSVGPQMDAVYLEPTAKFLNGIVLKNCMFRGCSFQRITLFVGNEDYYAVRDHAILNWISPTPKSIEANVTAPIDALEPPGMRQPPIS